jgi:hypothetical protein
LRNGRGYFLPPFIDNNNFVSNLPNKPEFLPGPFSVPNLRPQEIKVLREDGQPLEKCQLGGRSTSSEQHPPFGRGVFKKAKMIMPRKTSRVPGELWDPTIEEEHFGLLLSSDGKDYSNLGDINCYFDIILMWLWY